MDQEILSTLQNGTGIYARLWELMERNQGENVFVNSVEEGVKLVKGTKNTAVMAGRRPYTSTFTDSV